MSRSSFWASIRPGSFAAIVSSRPRTVRRTPKNDDKVELDASTRRAGCKIRTARSPVSTPGAPASATKHPDHDLDVDPSMFDAIDNDHLPPVRSPGMAKVTARPQRCSRGVARKVRFLLESIFQKFVHGGHVVGVGDCAYFTTSSRAASCTSSRTAAARRERIFRGRRRLQAALEPRTHWLANKASAVAAPACRPSCSALSRHRTEVPQVRRVRARSSAGAPCRLLVERIRL